MEKALGLKEQGGLISTQKACCNYSRYRNTTILKDKVLIEGLLAIESEEWKSSPSTLCQFLLHYNLHGADKQRE